MRDRDIGKMMELTEVHVDTPDEYFDEVRAWSRRSSRRTNKWVFSRSLSFFFVTAAGRRYATPGPHWTGYPRWKHCSKRCG